MLKLMYISNDVDEVLKASKAGVDRIFIDLEILGKQERQKHRDTFITTHKISDVSKIRSVYNGELLVRVNPIHESSTDEINKVIESGADIVMLPMFKTPYEVREFINIVDGRVKVSLLLETTEALSRLTEIVKIVGIDEIHIGLNDLHLGLGLKFMFEILAFGLVEYIMDVCKNANISCGFGGVAKVSSGLLPAELIIGEHYRLGSKMVILSREFRQSYLDSSIDDEIKKIREEESKILKWTNDKFESNKAEVEDRVRLIIDG